MEILYEVLQTKNEQVHQISDKIIFDIVVEYFSNQKKITGMLDEKIEAKLLLNIFEIGHNIHHLNVLDILNNAFQQIATIIDEKKMYIATQLLPLLGDHLIAKNRRDKEIMQLITMFWL